MEQPLDRLADGLYAGPLVRHLDRLFRDHPDLHMKDMTLEEVGPGRRVKLGGRWVVNFGSDSFLGLDRDPRLHAAVRHGLDRWGTHNGSSRAFSSVASNVEAEEKIAAWLGAEAAVIYPSVTLANLGALPALLTRRDVVVADQYAHHSVQQGVRLATAGGVRAGTFAHDDPADLDRVLRGMRPYRSAVVAVDGVYSMTGRVASLAALREVAAANDAVLYVDDAHGTGVLGRAGRGTVLDALGDYRNVLVVGSLSKAVSCFGGFVACPKRVRFLLKVRSGPLVFGGPVPPPYLEAVCAAVDLVSSGEGDALREALGRNMSRFSAGARARGVPVVGAVGAIASVPVGDETATLRAGRAAFDRGYYVQSVIFPAVPHHGGLLRVQVNANHTAEEIDGLVGVLAEVVPERVLMVRDAAA
jgi:7-keto-8-aminopelargonate synthetase-like enzyme